MQDLIISLNRNVVRLSTVDKESSLRTTLVDVSKEIADDTRILDTLGFSRVLGDMISQISSLSKNKLSLNFIIETQDVYLRYVTISKKNVDLEEQIVSELKEKASDIPLEEIFFSYRKIAPFVYQFVGVKKDIVEKYIEVSNNIGIGLKSITPWVLALPKYEKVNDPAIFIAKTGDRQMIALSELNGVFFADITEKDRTEEELQSLIKELSFYKRSSPIKHVFTMNCDYLTLGGYEIKKIDYPSFSDKSDIPVGYEQHVIVNYLLDTDMEMVDSQINVLNLLPLPVVESKSASLVAVGSALAILILLGGFYGGYLFLKNRNSSENTQLAQNQNSENTQVLSESSENVQNNQQDTQEKVDAELKREDLKIRVENGAGVSGLAAKTKEFLEGLGYVVDEPATADNTTKATILTFKKDAPEGYRDLVSNDVKSKFPEIKISEESLPDDVTYDLLIIVGTSSEL